MDILIAIFTFAMIGGIARAAVLAVQAWKSGNRFSLKQIDVTDVHKSTCKRVSMVFQGLWLFTVLVIVSGMSDWVSGVYAIVACMALSAPVLTLQGGNWVLQDARWPVWVLLIGVGIQVGAMGVIEDYFYDHDDFVWSAIAAVSCFLGCYILQNGIAFWNWILSRFEFKKNF